jgi:hypothetical protein
MTQVVPAGFATPEAALQSFHYAFRHQTKEPLGSTGMKEIWDVPDDFDAPGGGYNIDLGLGYGGETGYRVAGQEKLADGVVRLDVEFEKDDGSWYTRQMIMADHGGHWRVRPVRVWR